jgi:hypothetical protein
MAGLDAGIQFATVAPQAQPSALAGLQPLRVGAPLQFQAMPAWQIPEEKPYIAQGIATAIQAIGAGIKAKYANEREERKEAARDKLEGKKLEEQIRHNKEIEANTAARIKATKATPEDSEDPIGSEGGGGGGGAPADETPISAEFVPAEPASQQGGSGALSMALPAKSNTPKIRLAGDTTSEPLITLNGAGSGGNTMALSVAPMKISGVAQSAPATASASEMSEEEKAAAAKQEQEFVKSAGQLAGLPPAKREEPKAEPKKSDPLTLGTDKGEKDTSQEDAVKQAAKNPPALTGVEAPSLDIGTVGKNGQPRPALANIPSIQPVEPGDMRTRFGNRPDMANLQAMRFNKKYPFGTVQAEVKEPNKNVPYWHVEYKDVSKERRGEIRTTEEHLAAQDIKREKLDFAKDQKITAMATAFNNHPKSKLMDLRKDAMERMLVAVKNHYNAKETNKETLPFIHQEMMDLFAQFASGKAPTEAQFHEAKSAFAGLSEFQSISKKFQHWMTGATLDDRDVNTILNLMVDTYNNSAEQTNAKLSNIGNILKEEHPQIQPYKMPVAYPLLKTTEYLKDQLKEKVGEDNLDKAEAEYQKLRGEYIDEANKTFKKDVKMPRDKQERFLKLQPIIDDYIALEKNHGVPPNKDDLRHFKKKVFGNKEYFEIPGFQSEYFGPRESSLMGGHYQGTPE